MNLRIKIFLAGAMLATFTPASSSANEEVSKIKDKIIQQSINQYSGRCPCPYFTDRAGRRCGARSAYSRPGGASPLCFRSDVTDEMVKRYQGH